MWCYKHPTKESNVLIMDRDDNTQISINLTGGTITSWRYNNWEQLFLSRHVKLDRRKELVGGISFDFPKVDGWPFGPQNGFARISHWELVRGPYVERDGEDQHALLRLVDNPHTRAFWNFHFEITLHITLAERHILMEYVVRNTSPILPLRFNVLLPVFLQVPDVRAVQVVGMRGTQYRDLTATDEDERHAWRQDRRHAIEVKNWTYRIYRDAPQSFEVFHVESDHSMRFATTGLDDVVVWNPWEEHGAEVVDFRPEQYDQMLCMAVGSINKEFRLAPGEQREMSLKMEVWTKLAICDKLY